MRQCRAMIALVVSEIAAIEKQVRRVGFYARDDLIQRRPPALPQVQIGDLQHSHPIQLLWQIADGQLNRVPLEPGRVKQMQPRPLARSQKPELCLWSLVVLIHLILQGPEMYSPSIPS